MIESPHFALLLMGDFGFRRAGQSPDFAIRSKKARALLAYVAMQEPMRMNRERLATLFWPDRTDRMARQNLRACVASLRRDLAGHADVVLTADDESIGLRNVIAVDARQLHGHAETDETARLEQAAGLYRGQFLADLTLDSEAFGEWVLAERTKLDAAAGGVLAKLASRADEVGAGTKAVEYSSRLTAIDPFREDWLRLRLGISARHLGRDNALVEARSFVARLKKELDVSPDAATIAFIERLKTEGGSSSRTIQSVDQNEARIRPSSFQPRAAPFRQPAAHRSLYAAAMAAVATVVFAGAVAAVFGPDIRTSWPLAKRQGLAVSDGSAIALAVSPFQSEAADTNDLARVLTQEVLADLSRFSGLRVFDGRAAAVERGAAGPRFLASGSLRRQGPVTRVNVGLTDNADQTLLWADDYTVTGENIAEPTGRIARRIARGFQLRATYALAQDLDTKRLDLAPLNALLARALTLQYRGAAPDDEAAATALYEEILRRDRDNPLALTGLAAQLAIASVNLLSVKKAALGRAEALVRQALRIDPRIERAHYWLGVIYRASGQRELALQSFERALQLNPSFVPAEASAGFTLVLSGRAEEGLRRIEDALAECSHDPPERQGLTFAGIARLELGDDQAAIRSLLQAASLGVPPPPLRAALASAYALTGERAKSREQFRLMQQAADPAALAQLLVRAAKSDGGKGSRYLQGLHLAANDTL